MSQLLIINGYTCPTPCTGMQIIESTTVDAGRNANNGVVGQKVGRNLWKINNLHWKMLTPAQWKSIKDALSPFFVKVTFTDDCNVRHTIDMYPSDRTADILNSVGNNYKKLETCSFNLIDCGW